MGFVLFCLYLSKKRWTTSSGVDTPVADHFKEEHSVRVSVLTSTPEEVVQRRLMERAWIRRLSREGSPWTLIKQGRWN